MSRTQKLCRLIGIMAIAAVIGASFAGTASAHTKAQKKAAQKSLLKMLKKNPGVIRSKAFVRKASHASLRLPLSVRLNKCIAGASSCTGWALSDDALSLNLGPTFGTKSGYVYGSLKATGVFKNSTDTGTLGDINMEVPTSTGLVASPVNVMHNSAVNGSTVVQFGCSNVVSGNKDAPTLNQTSGDTDSPNTLLRTARIGVNTNYTSGTANIFSPAGPDLTLSLAAAPRVWTVLRIMKELGDPHTANATATVSPATPITSDGEQCRQVYTGYKDSAQFTLNVTGDIEIRPAITRDNNVRLAVADLTSSTSHIAVSACLHAYAWYTALVDQTAAYFSQYTAAGTGTASPADTKADSPCNSATNTTTSGPLADLIDSDGDGTATQSEGYVELAADISLSTLTAEVLVGWGVDLGAVSPIPASVPQ